MATLLEILKKELIGKSIEITVCTRLSKIEHYEEVVKANHSTTDKQFATGKPQFCRTIKRTRDIGKTTSTRKWLVITDVNSIYDDYLSVIVEGDMSATIDATTEIKNIREEKIERILKQV
jgi:hypothetical protein